MRWKNPDLTKNKFKFQKNLTNFRKMSGNEISKKAYPLSSPTPMYLLFVLKLHDSSVVFLVHVKAL